MERISMPVRIVPPSDVSKAASALVICWDPPRGRGQPTA